MAAVSNILFLVHRLPYPPNKGDKVRSYHLLRHLQKNHRVFLGTFIDDPDDVQHLPVLQAMCKDLHVEHIEPRSAKIKSLSGLLTGEPLTLTYYRNAGMQRWVQQTVAEHKLQACVVFSSAMAQYAQPLLPDLPMLVDFVDVDSAKWTQYAPAHRWPLSMVYRREGRRLLAYERAVAAQAHCSYFVTPNETALFVSQAPESQGRVQSMGNGVDCDFFKPDAQLANPFDQGEQALVFTGAMDYWPNIDGVSWFVADMLPRLLARHPGLRFYIVGRSPPPAVLALAGDAVTVTGTVPDVRPYLRHANVVVAPLRVARGIQNKVLEAMAMGVPVVVARGCGEAVDAEPERDFLLAESIDDYVRQISRLLESQGERSAVGRAAREKVLRRYSWEAHLGAIDLQLEAPA